jgi:hypothetical protein
VAWLAVALLLAALPTTSAVRAQEEAAPESGVEPERGTVGTTFTFFYTGDAWAPGERVDWWVVGPGQEGNRPFDVGRLNYHPDEDGRFSWTWTAPEGVWSGSWRMVARGYDSYYAVQIPFYLQVGDEPFPEFRVEPTQGTPGTRFDFSYDGWPKGDVVDLWVLAPGMEEPYDLDRIYGDDGTTHWHWVAPDDVWSGTWVMGARGYYSEMQVLIPFTIVDGAPPPAAPTTGASSTSAVPGETLSFTATGYEPGEEMSFWVNAPGSARPMFSNGEDELYADADGIVTWQWTVPSTARLGQWLMVIWGEDTNLEQHIPFSVVRAGSAEAVTAQVEPESGLPGTSFLFTDTGFKPEEPLAYWATSPEGVAYSSDQGFWASMEGEIAVEWASPPDAMGGIWRMTIRGQNSLKEIEVEFTIDGAAVPPAGPPQGVAPEMGTPGTTFSFFASGFYRSEETGWWATAPDGTVYEGGVNVQASKEGRLEWQWTAPADAMPGNWTMAAQGRQSNHQPIISFEIQLDGPDVASPAAPNRVIPESGPPGTTFTFEAQVEPGEQLGFWATAPDGRTTYPGEQEINADDNGFVTWTWTAPADAPPGMWMMTVQSSPSDEIVANTLITLTFVVDAAP